jgi:hypothetical protein
MKMKTRKMRQLTFLISISIACIASCSKDGKAKELSPLEGKWKVELVSNGLSGLEYPFTNGGSLYWSFTQDSIIITKNGQRSSIPYTFSSVGNHHCLPANSQGVTYIQYEHNPANFFHATMVLRNKPGYDLVIDDGACTDAASYFMQRVP